MPDLHSISILGEAHRDLRIFERSPGDMEEPTPNLLKEAVPADGRLEVPRIILKHFAP